MSFAFGLLIGFVIGCAFTLWLDRRPRSACTKGGFHYWQRYDENTESRFCTKCGRNEEEVLYD